MRVAEKGFSVTDQLLERVGDARRRSDALFDLLRDDTLDGGKGGAIYERPIPERHRIIFYVGHLEAFDWNLLSSELGDGSSGLKSAHPDFDRLFAFGIDPVGGGLPTDQPSDWPSLRAVRDYVNEVRDTLDESLANISVKAPETGDGFPLSTLLNVAIEHRLMHIETLAYMLHRLPLDRKIGRPDSAMGGSLPVVHGMVSVPAGEVNLGLRRTSENGVAFGWDNEYEAHTADVSGFEIDRYKVTNRQFLEFMTDGGYETRSLWNEADWNWKSAQQVSHPAFWEKRDSEWYWRGMFAETPLDRATLDWPVYVSQAEASAYAGWAGKSLPTEAEWQRAAYGLGDGGTSRYPWGNEVPDAERGNFDFYRWDPAPVNAFPDGQSAFGVHDLLGNGWEWTSTPFGPFPGFEPFPFYRGYSADFFDGKHFVMKGASSRTAACMLRSSFRNWFQAHYQYVYAGFRCVRR
ncbi:MAG: SUMF1/EgtB/PvdO family nonheme iron enzyme [Terriglobales bacterium]